MVVFCHNEFRIGSNGTVDKLVVIWIILYKVEPEESVDKFNGWRVQEGLDDVRGDY